MAAATVTFMIARLIAALFLMLFAVPAWAEDTIVDVPSCNVFCSMWRNISGTVPASAAAPADTTAQLPDAPLPDAVDGAETPRPNLLVRQRGVVMSESAAERAAAKRQRAKLERELVFNPALAISTRSSDVKR